MSADVGSERLRWLNGWPRLGRDAVLLGTGVYCVGCGKFGGVTCVAVDFDWTPPETEPDWPFPEDDCPVHNPTDRYAQPAPPPKDLCRVCGGTGERPETGRLP